MKLLEILLESLNILTEDRIEILKQKFSMLPEKEFQEIIDADPSKNKEFSQWLLNLYKQHNLKLEDLYKVKDYLYLFMKIKKKSSIQIEKDINKYKSIQDLFVAIDPYDNSKDIMSKNEIKEDNLAYETSKWKIYIPKTYEDSCILGKGTQWCTATEKTDNYYKHYSSQGQLYILISKIDPTEKYQFHFESGQFMDKNDHSINYKQFFGENPELKDFFHDKIDISYKLTLGIKLKSEDYYIKGDLKILEPCTLPDGLKIDGTLYANTNLWEIPNNLTVGNLHARDSKIMKIGENVTVKGNCNLINTMIKTIPSSLKVGNKLEITYCKNLVSLPDNYTIHGNFELWGCKSLKKLPNNFTVEGILDLSDTEIEELPNNIVYKKLTIESESKLKKLPSHYIANEIDLTILPNLEELPYGLQFNSLRYERSVPLPKAGHSIYVNAKADIVIPENFEINHLNSATFTKVVFPEKYYRLSSAELHRNVSYPETLIVENRFVIHAGEELVMPKNLKAKNLLIYSHGKDGVANITYSKRLEVEELTTNLKNFKVPEHWKVGKYTNLNIGI
jgi:hypothetical protein